MEDSKILDKIYVINLISCSPDPDRTAIGNGPLEGKDAIYENWR